MLDLVYSLSLFVFFFFIRYFINSLGISVAFHLVLGYIKEVRGLSSCLRFRERSDLKATKQPK